MPIRKALAYSKKKFTHYTRKSQKVKHLNYIKAVPNQKVSKFYMGDTKKNARGEFTCFIKVYSMINCKIRDLALEASRQLINNRLVKRLMNNFYLACKPYPHQVIRENKTFSGGSKGERVQSGMAHSFGTTMYRSAVVKAGEPVFIIGYTNKKDTDFIRALAKSASAKLPCSVKIIYEESTGVAQ
jgi:large subunit ribosomal protein L10e